MIKQDRLCACRNKLKYKLTRRVILAKITTDEQKGNKPDGMDMFGSAGRESRFPSDKI